MSLLNTIPPVRHRRSRRHLRPGPEHMGPHPDSAARLRSVSPFLLAHTWSYYSHITQHPTLSMPLTTCIRMLVSQAGNPGLLHRHEQRHADQHGWLDTGTGCRDARRFQQQSLQATSTALLGLVLKVTRDPTGSTPPTYKPRATRAGLKAKSSTRSITARIW